LTLNPATKRDCGLEIEILQNAPRDKAKLRELLKLKEKENEQEAKVVYFSSNL
jgi:hypothetical protein